MRDVLILIATCVVVLFLSFRTYIILKKHSELFVFRQFLRSTSRRLNEKNSEAQTTIHDSGIVVISTLTLEEVTLCCEQAARAVGFKNISTQMSDSVLIKLKASISSSARTLSVMIARPDISQDLDHTWNIEAVLY